MAFKLAFAGFPQAGRKVPHLGRTARVEHDSWILGCSAGSMVGAMSSGWSGAATEPHYLVETIAHHRDAVAAAGEFARSDRPKTRSL